MGLYDAVDRGGAGRKKEKTLRRPLLIAASVRAEKQARYWSW